MTSNKRRLSSTASLDTHSCHNLCGLCRQPLHESDNAKSTSIPPISNSVDARVNANTKENDHDSVSGPPMKTKRTVSESPTNLQPECNSTTDHVDLPYPKAIISCSYASAEIQCCKALDSEDKSPHYHLACLQTFIPPKSSLYSNICQFIEDQEEQKKKKKLKAAAKTLQNENETTFALLKLQNNDKTETIPRSSHLPDTIPLERRKSNNDINVQGTNSGRNTPIPSSSSSSSRKDAKISNPFVCNACDVQGTSKYLREYFHNFRWAKCGYYEDEEAADWMHPLTEKQTKTENHLPNDIIEKNSFVKYLISQQNLSKTSRVKPTEITLERIRDIFEYTCTGLELDRDSINAFSLIGQPVRLFSYITNSHHTGRIIDARSSDEIGSDRLKDKTKSDFSFGCEKKATNTAVHAMESSINNVLLDRDIGQVQYLVRFRARIEGRKVALQQWLYLEEHPIMLGLNVIWAKVEIKKKAGKKVEGDNVNAEAVAIDSKQSVVETLIPPEESLVEKKRRIKRMDTIFQPAQIFLRSTLEMIHVDDMNSTTQDLKGNSSAKEEEIQTLGLHYKTRAPLNAIALMFGKTYECVRLRLSHRKSKSVDEESIQKSISCDDSLSTIKENLSFIQQSFEDISAVSFQFPSPVVQKYINIMKSCDEHLVKLIACACLEEEEQNRVLQGHFD